MNLEPGQPCPPVFFLWFSFGRLELALISFLGVWFLGQPLLSAAGIVPVQAAAEGTQLAAGGTRLASALAPAIHLLLAAYFSHLAARTVYLTVVYYRRLR